MTISNERYLILPYSMIVGQNDLRLALELTYVNPAIGGVLATGQRGTAKSTTVRSFTRMAYGELPVTLPIGATEDRVIGSWDVGDLMRGGTHVRAGLLMEASKSRARMLYIDEVNLLDEYLVNIILDTLSTGHLGVHRDHIADEHESVHFTLIGTMNPDEGGLRPQLLDRFGLVVEVESEDDQRTRVRILDNVLAFEEQRGWEVSPRLDEKLKEDQETRAALEQARVRLPDVTYSDQIKQLCAALAVEFEVPGHRGELALLRAAWALAAWKSCDAVRPEHVRKVAKLALIHRRPATGSTTLAQWKESERERVARIVTERAGAAPR